MHQKGHLLLYNYVTKQKHTKEGVLNEELAANSARTVRLFCFRRYIHSDLAVLVFCSKRYVFPLLL